MKAQEKLQIYDLLKTISTYVTGFVPNTFLGKKPIFEDDTEFKAEEKIETKIENSSNAKNLNNLNDEKILTLKSLENEKSSVENLQNDFNVFNFGLGVQNPTVLVICQNINIQAELKNGAYSGAAIPGSNAISSNPKIQLLEKMLSAIKLSKSKNCFITDEKILQPTSAENQTDSATNNAAENQTQNPQTFQNHSALKNIIRILRPKIILAMGENLAQSIFNNNLELRDMRGNFFTFESLPILITYDTTPLLQNPALKAAAWEDLKLFRSELLKIAPNYEI